MLISKIFPKYFSSLLILVILSTLLFSNVLLPQKKAQAQLATVQMQMLDFVLQRVWEVQDIINSNLQSLLQSLIAEVQAWTQWDILNQRALKDAWNQARAQLLGQMTDEILRAVQQGPDGQPGFVTDWRPYLDQKTDEVTNIFINEELGQGNSCTDTSGTPFNQTIQQIYRNEQQNGSYSGLTSCAYDAQAFYNDFENGGGWDAFAYTLLPEGNFLGSLLLADDYLMLKTGKEYMAQSNKLIADQGFLGDESTPGIIKSHSAQRAATMNLDWLLNADDLNEFASSLIDSFFSRIVNEGLSAMRLGDRDNDGDPNSYQYHRNASTTLSRDTIFIPTVPPPALNLNYVISNANHARSLRDDVLPLIRQNLEDQILIIQVESLTVLEDIRTRLSASSCSNLLPRVNAQIAQINDEINNPTTGTQAKISQTNAAISEVQKLVTDMEAVLAADANGNPALLSQALATFKTSNAAAVLALQTLLKPALYDSKEKDLKLLFEAARRYSTQIMQDYAGYAQNLGVNVQPAWQTPEYYYGCRRRLQIGGGCQQCADAFSSSSSNPSPGGGTVTMPVDISTCKRQSPIEGVPPSSQCTILDQIGYAGDEYGYGIERINLVAGGTYYYVLPVGEVMARSDFGYSQPPFNLENLNMTQLEVHVTAGQESSETWISSILFAPTGETYSVGPDKYNDLTIRSLQYLDTPGVYVLKNYEHDYISKENWILEVTAIRNSSVLINWELHI